MEEQTQNPTVDGVHSHFAGDPGSLLDILKRCIVDQKATNSHYEPWYIAALIIIAELAGCDSDRKIAWFLNKSKDEIGRYIDLSPGIPSHQTISRFRQTVDPVSVDRALHEQYLLYGGAGQGDFGIWFIDGTSTIAAARKLLGEHPLYSLDAIDAATRLCPLCLPVDGKTNEVVILREMVETGRTEGKIIVTDALHFTSATLRTLQDHNTGFCIPVKSRNGTGNDSLHKIREALLARMDGAERRLFLADETYGADYGVKVDLLRQGNLDYHSIKGLNKGRVEFRKIWHLNDAEGILDPQVYPGIKSLSWVKSYRVEVKRGRGGAKPHIEVSLSEFGLASSFTAPAEFVLALKMAEWDAEEMHRVKDVNLREDWRTNRGFEAVGSSAGFRRMEFNILQMMDLCLPQAGGTYSEKMTHLTMNLADAVMMVTGYNEEYPTLRRKFLEDEIETLKIREEKEIPPERVQIQAKVCDSLQLDYNIVYDPDARAFRKEDQSLEEP